MLAKWLGTKIDIPPDPNKQPRPNMIWWRNVLYPGLRYMERCILERGWQQPVEGLDMWVDEMPPRLVVCAFWKDGSKHYTYMTPEELQGRGHIDLFEQKVLSLTPQSYFDDEVVVAYDEPVNW